ncbi:MAG: sigma-70 family RNA polymerase sigma factor [Phycisphaeraceae bacterium]
MSELTLRWGKAQPSVTAFVRSIVRNHHDAEDIIQATVAHLLDHYDEYDPARPFVAWAIGIARIRILRYRDQNQRKPLLLGEDAMDALSGAMSLEAEDADERLEALEHCIGRLTDKHRDVLAKRYRQQLSRKDIADSLGIRENSVSVMLRRVRSVLEDCVTQRMGGPTS